MSQNASSADSPHVLFVDDNDQVDPRQLSDVLRQYEVDSRVRHPEETFMEDLDWANLVVVDYFMNFWAERDETDSVARAPHNGLAVAASMRSALLPSLGERFPGVVPSRPVAFALWSSNLNEATFGLPEEVLPHVFSRENNLEWAFHRSDLLNEQGGRQIALLAGAVTHLPERWPSQAPDVERQVLIMLDLIQYEKNDETLDSVLWRKEARNDILNCRPPIHELSERSHGLALLRWLLHRIFPYPCFILDEQQLCARLRVDRLVGGAVKQRSLLEVLSPYEYSGMLAGFDGRRWWRAGVEDWLFTETEGQSGSSRAVAELALRHGATRKREWFRPVIVIDGDLSPSMEFVEVEETVRVDPDDWPVFADDAFALREKASEDPTLRSLVHPADRPLLGQMPDAGDAT